VNTDKPAMAKFRLSLTSAQVCFYNTALSRYTIQQEHNNAIFHHIAK